jgi:hypothetical protein
VFAPYRRPQPLDSPSLGCEPFGMSSGAKSVLDAFEQLPPAERDEVVVELLRRTAASRHESPSDNDLLRAADDVFLELDRSEG